MKDQGNALNWFEISVQDLDRAKKFYETIFDIVMPVQDMGGALMAFFPYAPGSGKVSGALVKGPSHTPSKDGAKIYLNGNPNLDTALSLVEGSGGKVLEPKFKISDEVGFMAWFSDTEGNVLALHSNH